MLSTCAAPCARAPVLLGRGSKTSGGRALRRANAARKSAAPKMGRDRRICAVRADAALPESELEEGEIQGVRPRLACAGRHRAAPSARAPTARAPIVHPAPRPTFGATRRATSRNPVAKKASRGKKTVPFAHLFLVRRPSLSLCSKRFRQIEGYGAISTKPATPLLDTVNVPAHLKSMDMDQLKQVAKELRADLIYNVSQTGATSGRRSGSSSSPSR